MLNKKFNLVLILMMVIALSGAFVLPAKAVVVPYELPTNPLCTGVTGELNGDGLINQYDTEVMLKMAKGLEPSNPCADLDLDGFVGPADISILTKIYKIDLPAHPEIVLKIAELSAAAAAKASSSSSTSCTLGDANGDNMIDYKDEDLLIEMTKGLIPATTAADLDGDGYVGPADISTITMMIKIFHKVPTVTDAEKGNCDAATAAILYSVDGGVKYASTATVKNGDTLKIKVVFSKPLNNYEYANLNIDNGLASDIFMPKIDNTVSSYDLLITKDANLTATVSIQAQNGVFIDNIALTSGKTFKILSTTPPVIILGGGSLPSCDAVTYSDWSVCADGKSTRQMISKTPFDCEPAASQILEVEKTCTVETQTVETPTDEQGEVLGEKYVDEREQQLAEIFDDAHYIWPGDTNLLLGYMNANRDLALEQKMSSKYGSILGSNVQIALGGVDTVNAAAITNFLTYGTKTTLKLGAGERAGVLNSYKAAFSKLPQTEEDWRDAIKIGNGRWPSQTSAEAEARAKVNFEMVYKRSADMANANDNAAVTTMAYGLRPLPRNLNSEKEAIKIFKGVFGYYPVKATAWDVVRAIAYSGAKR